MRCQAIKRDGFQCNYNSRNNSLYCGVHANFDSSMLFEISIRLEDQRIRSHISSISQTFEITRQQAYELFSESLNLETQISKDKEIDNIIDSFTSLEIPKDDCSICISTPKDLVKSPCCLKDFCKDCLKSWIKIKKNCPACRSILN